MKHFYRLYLTVSNPIESHQRPKDVDYWISRRYPYTEESINKCPWRYASCNTRAPNNGDTGNISKLRSSHSTLPGDVAVLFHKKDPVSLGSTLLNATSADG